MAADTSSTNHAWGGNVFFAFCALCACVCVCVWSGQDEQRVRCQ